MATDHGPQKAGVYDRIQGHGRSTTLWVVVALIILAILLALFVL